MQFIFAVVLGVVAAFLVWNYSQNLQQQVQIARQQVAPPPVIEQSDVLVAGRDITARTQLTADMLKVVKVPSSAKLPQTLTTVDAAIGKFTQYQLVAGQPLFTTTVGDDPYVDTFTYAIPPGDRAVAITVNSIIGAGGLIVPGDKVDIIVTFDKGVFGADMATVVLQDVQVLAVAQAYTREETPTAATTPTPTAVVAAASNLIGGGTATPAPTSTPFKPDLHPDAQTLTLALTPEQAERVILAEQHGQIRLALRPANDDSIVDIGDMNLDAVPKSLPSPEARSVISSVVTVTLPVAVTATTTVTPTTTAQIPVQITGVKISPTNLEPDQLLRVELTVKNESGQTVKTQGPDPEYTYVQGQTFNSQKFPSQPGTYRVGLSFDGAQTLFPYRWGLGGDLAPGASTTVVGLVKVTYAMTATTFWAGVIQEPDNVIQDKQDPTLVTVLPAHTAVVTVQLAYVRSGPSVAANVIGSLPYGTQVPILGQQNDWYQVKLPDGRIGYVAAGWIVSATGMTLPTAIPVTPTALARPSARTTASVLSKPKATPTPVPTPH